MSHLRHARNVRAHTTTDPGSGRMGSKKKQKKDLEPRAHIVVKPKTKRLLEKDRDLNNYPSMDDLVHHYLYTQRSPYTICLLVEDRFAELKAFLKVRLGQKGELDPNIAALLSEAEALVKQRVLKNKGREI